MEQTEAERFLDKVVTDTSGLAIAVVAALGDRLGLFKDLARQEYAWHMLRLSVYEFWHLWITQAANFN